MNIPMRLVVQRHSTDERFLAPIRERALSVNVLAQETGNERLKQVSDDFNHLLCAVAEQRGDLVRMQQMFETTAAGLLATALKKLVAAVTEKYQYGDETSAIGDIHELHRVAEAIAREVILQLGDEL